MPIFNDFQGQRRATIEGKNGILAKQTVRVEFKGDFGIVRRAKGGILGWKGDFEEREKGVK